MRASDWAVEGKGGTWRLKRELTVGTGQGEEEKVEEEEAAMDKNQVLGEASSNWGLIAGE